MAGETFNPVRFAILSTLNIPLGKGEHMNPWPFFWIDLSLLVVTPIVVYILSARGERLKSERLSKVSIIVAIVGAIGCSISTFFLLHNFFEWRYWSLWTILSVIIAFGAAVFSFMLSLIAGLFGEDPEQLPFAL